MFENILIGNKDKKNNFIQNLEADADIEITKDREKYKPIYDYILKISNDMGLIISDIDLLLGRKVYWEFMQIYHKDAIIVSKELLESLCLEFGEKFVLKISEFEESYSIEYNLRRICTIYTLKLFKKYDISEFIKPLEFKSGIHKVKLLPPILEVITLYTYLYNVGMSSDWISILDTIKQVEVFVQNDLDAIIAKATDKVAKDNDILLLISSPFDTGKDAKDTGKDAKDTGKDAKDTGKDMQKMKQLHSLLLEFVSDSNYLLIHQPTTDEPLNEVEELDIISQNSIDSDYKAIIAFLSKFTQEGIVYKEKSLYIHNNYTMKKYAFYILSKSGLETHKKHILNIYNNSAYELISYKTITFGQNILKIVDPVVSIKFIYINIWSSILLQRVSKYDLKKYKLYILNQIKLLNMYKEKIDLYTKKVDFIGKYEDIIIHKKKLAIANPNVNKSAFYCHNL